MDLLTPTMDSERSMLPYENGAVPFDSQARGHKQPLQQQQQPGDALAMAAQFKQLNGEHAGLVEARKQEMLEIPSNGAAHAPNGHAVGNGYANGKHASYATDAYRHFLSSAGTGHMVSGHVVGHASGHSSAASSLASSAASSRQSSRPTSGYSSAAVSNQSSRAASPANKREGVETHVRTVQPLHNSASVVPVAQAQVSQQQQQQQAYVDSIQFPVVHASQFSGALPYATGFHGVPLASDAMLDLGSLNLAKSSAPPAASAARPRPVHFKFSQGDIERSWRKALEKERAKAEKEEAHRRAVYEAEQARRRHEAAQQAARDAAFHASQAAAFYRAGTVGAEFSFDSDDSDSPSPTNKPVRRRAVPLQPAHFRFSAGDLSRSLAKPVNKQNIGHWSSFPRSGTQMLTTEQLRQWLRRRMEEQAWEKQQKEKERERRVMQQQQQLFSPHVPVTNGFGVVGDKRSSKPSEFGSARVVPRGPSARRASLPLGSLHAGIPLHAKPQQMARPTHARSNTESSFSREKLLPASLVAGGADKLSGSQYNSARHESERAILRRVNGMAAPVRNNDGSPYANGATNGHSPLLTSQQASLDAAAARRQQILQARAWNAANMSSHVQSAPLLHERASRSPPMHTERGTPVKVRSAHASPVRVNYGARVVSARANASFAARSPPLPSHALAMQPAVPQQLSASARSRLLHASEAKVGSAHSSPVQTQRSSGSGSGSPGQWSTNPSYERALADAYAYAGANKLAAANSMYRDGYAPR